MIPIVLTFIYLIYLSLICQSLIIYDSIGYELLGNQILHTGLIGYLKAGPNREPLYILVVAFAQYLGKSFTVDPRWMLKLLHIGMLVISQILAFFILRGLRLKTWALVLALLYIGISPVLVNSTMWVYSEIAAVPIILAIILSAARSWKGVYANERASKQIIN